MSERSTVGREIRRLRDAAGITLAELSRRTGVREAYLAAIEDDREEPSVGALRRVVNHLEPAGASYESIARLLTAPEFQASGEYASDGDARTGPPALAGADRRARPQPTLDVDGTTTAAEGVWRHGVERDQLQFDRVITEPPPSGLREGLTITCALCRMLIETEYYDVNGTSVCSRCRTAVESAADTPRGIVPFLIAGAFGLGAGAAGAMIYYAVIAIAHLEIGLVAVLIGYMVGKAVRKGAGGRGGRRFQVLAVALTYVSVALAYTPIAIRSLDANRTAQKAATTSGAGRTAEAAVSRSGPHTTPTLGGFLVGLMLLSAFIAALPVLVVLGSFPSGVISAIIIFVGMRQAWRMTGAPLLQIFGPYRVGAVPVAASV